MAKKEKTKQKTSPGQVLIMALFVAIGGVCGFMLPQLFEDRLADASPAMAFLLIAAEIIIMYAAMLAQIIIHEAGHLVFGLFGGYRFRSFRVGSFMLIREDDKLKLRRMSLAGTAGQCLMTPPAYTENFPVTLYNLGGSLMNLITAVIFALLAIPARGFASDALIILAVIGAVFALMNGVPLRTGTVDNDGRNIIEMRKSEAARRAFWIQLSISDATACGIRLRDLPAEWFEYDPNALDGSMTAAIAVFRTNRLMDEHKFEEADALMAEISTAKGVIGIYRSLMACDRIYCAAVRGDFEAADALYTREQQKFMRTMKTYPSVIRTEYVYALLAAGDETAAEKALARFEKTARSYPYISDIESERELIAIADAKK